MSIASSDICPPQPNSPLSVFLKLYSSFPSIALAHHLPLYQAEARMQAIYQNHRSIPCPFIFPPTLCPQLPLGPDGELPSLSPVDKLYLYRLMCRTRQSIAYFPCHHLRPTYPLCLPSQLYMSFFSSMRSDVYLLCCLFLLFRGSPFRSSSATTPKTNASIISLRLPLHSLH